MRYHQTHSSLVATASYRYDCASLNTLLTYFLFEDANDETIQYYS